MPFGPSDYRPPVGEQQVVKPLTETDRQWLQQNAKSLALVLEASSRPACAFYDPRTAHDPVKLRNKSELIALAIVSGRELEETGKLDDAIDRYFSALRVDFHLKEFSMDRISANCRLGG